ncbi:MAG TPA: hypothetical protein VFX12_14540 [Vicinamibacterales bacterium]|nr:hypothetical protein [Vicinamibacterales bacterium]
MLRNAFIAMALCAGASPVAQDWAAADRATRRLPPSLFTELPQAIRLELVRRGCTIPQPFAATEPQNVIEGPFTSADRVDWAVLCSRRGVSSILVFRGGATAAPDEFGAAPDSTYLETIDDRGTIGYTRALAVATPEYIRRHDVADGGPQPPPLDHEGIDDQFLEKASVVWYWYRGRWLELQGAD